MLQEKIRNRNLTADFLKGILILCVLYGHSVSMINGLRNITWDKSIVNIFVTSFEMPLFILISGYFLAFSLNKKTPKTVLWKRIVSIALPLAIWEGIPAVLKVFLHNSFSVKELAKVVYQCVFPGRLWFLSCFLFCTIFVVVVEALLRRIKRKSVLLCLEFLIYTGIIIVLHKVWHSFVHVPFLFPFFLTGFLVAKYELLQKKGIRRLLVVLSVLFVILYPLYKPENSFYILGTYIPKERGLTLLPIFLHRFVLGLCGCSALYLLADFVCKRKANHRGVLFITFLGSKTMEVYILSMFIQELLQVVAGFILSNTAIITNVTAPIVFGPIFLVTLITICIFINYLIGKSKKLHKSVFGR